MDPSLLLGALLIGVGLALAALAYSLITERAGTEPEGETKPKAVDAPAPEAVGSDETVGDEAVEEPEEDVKADDEPLPSPEGEEEPVAEGTQAQPEPEAEETEPESEPEAAEPEPASTQGQTAEKPEPPAERPTFPVATLRRDEVSGELVIQVGDKSYRSKDELEASRDWSRVRFAADDLAKWIVGEPTGEKVDRPASPRRPSKGKSDRGKEGEAPRSMVEEIDEILQEPLVDSPHADKAVRLMEGPGGMARVLIGIDSYSIEDVPDEDIQSLIKQAVAQWEATR
jgi:hypothetical protein